MLEAFNRKSIVYRGYDREQQDRAVRDTRVAAVFAAVAILVFAALDIVVYPHLFWTFFILRLGVVVASAAIYGATYVPSLRHYGRELGMLEYIVTAISIVLMVHFADGYLSPYYAGINVILIVFLAILPMDHVRAMIVCGIIYAAYIVPIMIHGSITNWPVLIGNNAFLLATMILAILSSYMYTRLRYREYAARHRLAEANGELKKLDLMKSQFFANVSHEVRTPLTSIIAPVQSLYQGDVGDMTPQQQALLSQVYRNSLRLLDMINQMLDFARFDARKMQLKLTRVNVGHLAEESVTIFQEIAAQKGLQLEVAVDDSVSAVYLDREKTERILSNLLRNALKFTELGRVSVAVRQGDRRVALVVEDTGIGIPSNKLASIFERFSQVDGSSTRRYEGTGLGLTIVKEAVELQHGRITVQSIPGKGATFSVSLPTNLEELAPDAFIDRRAVERRGQDRRVADDEYEGPERRVSPRRRQDLARVSLEDMAFIDAAQPTSPVETPQPESGPPSGISVLYVEDNADLRTYVCQMLAGAGHAVTAANDGREGWNAIQKSRPDVVVSDVMMPHLDGYDLLRHIRDNKKFRNIPVVLTTAKSETDERIRGLESGADDYLAKPINIRELDARIRNLVTARMFQEAISKAKELEARMHDLTLGFSRSLELRDHYTADHSNDVLQFGSIIAEELDIPIDETFRDSLLLHDIGKLGVPDSILLKEGPLDNDEWRTMKLHAELGYQLLKDFESFREISENILAHQERYDGSGYPRALSGEDIPMVARIIAVADAWHAMIEDRPYRSALTVDAAIAELENGRGTHFDPRVVDAFLAGMRKRGNIPANR